MRPPENKLSQYLVAREKLRMMYVNQFGPRECLALCHSHIHTQRQERIESEPKEELILQKNTEERR